jgi:hypothetical protein
MCTRELEGIQEPLQAEKPQRCVYPSCVQVVEGTLPRHLSSVCLIVWWL